MGKKEEILNIASKNGGYITTKELTEYNINSRFLTSLVKEKKLSRASRGYYILPNTFSDDFYIILSKCKKAFFQNVRKLFFRMLPLYIFIIFLIGYL